MRPLPEAATRAGMVSRVRPTLRIVSIIPGMETAAPERTETSSGLGPRPKVCPRSVSTRARAFATADQRAGGVRRPAAQ